MNNPRRWHGWNPNIRHMPMGEPVPETMDWDTWIGVAQYHDYNHDYHLGQWRCWSASFYLCFFTYIPLKPKINRIGSSVFNRYSLCVFAPQLSSPPTPICCLETRTTV